MYVKRIMVFGLLAVVVAGWGVFPPAAAQTLAGAGDAPAVFFPEKVIDGVSVVHDFVVFNKGTAPLQISNVRTG
jgi:hypothetical protein